ncbi:MAG: peptide ABC transporter substrate-binding protein [Opitutae bacterium]|nr:peptide ABC transporter substrate-binding protein [Opitutae bacterium]
MALRRTLFALLCLLLTLAGCTRRETPVDAGIRTQTLLIGNGAEPQDLDPQIVTVLTDQNIMMALFEGLTALDEQTTRPVPAAAERWETSADGLTWTFHLRAGLKWSDGEPLTAGDFVAAWQRALDPRLAAENAWYLYAVKNAEAFNTGKLAEPAALGFAAPDEHTIVLTLEHPVPYLPALVSLPAWFPVNPRVIAKFGAQSRRDTAWTRAGNHVGNGPFRLVEWSPNARIVVEKNPHHREAAQTKLQQVVFFPVENPDVEERNYRAGQLHVTFNLPVDKISGWRSAGQQNASAQLRLDPILQTFFLRFNTRQSPLDNPAVRRALSLAIDRDILARTVLQGSRQPAHSLTPPGTGGYVSRTRVHTDLATARQLLVDAGYPGGHGLPVFEIQTRNDALNPRLAEALQAMWQRELGIRTTIAPTEQKIWIQNQKTLSYAVTLAAWTADFPDPVTFLGLFTADSAYNWTGWTNVEFDALLARAAVTLDPVQRYELFQQAEKLLLESAPVSPVHFGAQTYLLHPAVKGWVPAPLGFRRYQYLALQTE